VSVRRRLAVIALAGLPALLLAFAIDHAVARAMADLPVPVLSVARFVTWFGQGGVVLYPAGLLMALGLAFSFAIPSLAGRLEAPLRSIASVFIVVAAAGLADDVLKILFGRARPYLWLEGDNSGFGFLRYSAKFASFPSGHTTTSFAAAIVLGMVLPRHKPWFLLAAALVGVSRIVLDVHYPSDVVAGALLGTMVAFGLGNWLESRGWLLRCTPQDSGFYGVDRKRAKKTGAKRN
jgi:membrane-associated phospholipid phosphatase